MTLVNLEFIGKDSDTRWKAIEWLLSTYGPADEHTWHLQGLDQIYFQDDRHATYFILKWT